ncbi:MAG TPA: hypothetical protein VMG12_02165, partial [Polyangiaceae bacterium]|nr:hypothetical protein [Polyangiaceae bacterium]
MLALGRRWRVVWSGAALGVAGSGIVQADAAARGVSQEGPALVWQAPEGCPVREAVLEQTAAVAQRERVLWSRFSLVRGVNEPAAGGWRLTLEFVGSDGVARRT